MTSTTILILNVSSVMSCERCDDTGVIPLDLVLIYDGHTYDRFAGACSQCEEGDRRRASIARVRHSWRYHEVAA